MSSAPRIPTSLLGSPRPGPSSAGAGAAEAVGRPGHRAPLIGPKFVAPAGSLKPQALEPAAPGMRMSLYPHRQPPHHLCLWQRFLTSPQMQNEMGLRISKTAFY